MTRYARYGGTVSAECEKCGYEKTYSLANDTAWCQINYDHIAKYENGIAIHSSDTIGHSWFGAGYCSNQVNCPDCNN